MMQGPATLMYVASVAAGGWFWNVENPWLTWCGWNKTVSSLALDFS